MFKMKGDADFFIKQGKKCFNCTILIYDTRWQQRTAPQFTARGHVQNMFLFWLLTSLSSCSSDEYAQKSSKTAAEKRNGGLFGGRVYYWVVYGLFPSQVVVFFFSFLCIVSSISWLVSPYDGNATTIEYATDVRGTEAITSLSPQFNFRPCLVNTSHTQKDTVWPWERIDTTLCVLRIIR